MGKYLLITLFFTFIFSIAVADNNSEIKITFSKKDILKLADKYVNNNLGINNPVVVDIDNDGDFDILKFNNKGNVEYYKNTGTLENPFFVLENKKFDNYEMNSFFSGNLPVTVFFADKDGDGDVDIFGVSKDKFDTKTNVQKYNVAYAENAFDLDHYTLITIILVLIIVVLLIAIL